MSTTPASQGPSQSPGSNSSHSQPRSPVLDRIECLVIGAGVVGLACARALALAGREVVVVEREASFGSGVSSRSSEVMHAGLYDPPGSLKAELCVRGNRLLRAYCAERGIAHRRCGKLVVATRAQDVSALEVIRGRALANGVDGIDFLTSVQALALEPELRCEAALWSASSGIVDSHALMASLLADAEAGGAVLAVASGFRSAHRGGDAWLAQFDAGPQGERFCIQACWLINAAGLDAQAVAAHVSGVPAAAVPRRHLAKGHYFALSGRAPFSRLIYPTPVDGGLGIHLTLDLAGQARFGPDVEWIESDAPGAALDYRVDALRSSRFEAAVRRYWPGLPNGALVPAYSGIRPKLSGRGEAARDFRIDGPNAHGAAGLIQLFGIESPGLTAALAIAERVAALVD